MSSNQPDMAELLASADIMPLQKNDVIEGTIISLDKHEIWLDLGMQGTGLVVGRDLEGGGNTSAQVGDTMSASVMSPQRATQD